MIPKDFNKKIDYSTDKYDVYEITTGDTKFNRIKSNVESICILPFFMNDHEKVSSLVLANCADYTSENSNFLTCINHTFNQDAHDSIHNCFKDCVKKNLNLSEFSPNDVFYLGVVNHTIPFNKKYRCYAMNLSNYFDKFEDIDQSQLHQKNKKILDLKNFKFSSAVNGHVTDTLCLSACLLLLSYFSE